MNNGEVMEFPKTWEEYEKDYGFNDSKEVYTNNSRLIQSFRVKQWLDHLPSIKPKPKTAWIPVSERMPEDGDEYVITIRERWGKDEEWDYETTTAYYQNGKWSPSYDVDEGQEWKVIAWMPLPESYLEDYEET